MRLTVVDAGHTWTKKLLLGVIRVASGHRVPDVVRLMFYRPEFFGKPSSALVHALLRGPSEWSVGERELFAAFTSRLNRCEF
jgi:hypothetical protein